MSYSKKGWDIISDLIRTLGQDGGLLNDIQTDMFLSDVANIMDYMYGGKTFKNAVKAYKAEDESNAKWLEEFLDKLEIIW